MCQDLTSRVSTLSNRILQHVDLQNTTDGLPLSRPSHMECNKHDNTAHSNAATRIHAYTNTHPHWRILLDALGRSHKQHVARCRHTYSRRAHTDQPSALMQDKKDLLFLTSLRIWSEIPVGALEEMTIRATSQNACQSARCSRQHCKHTMLGKYINNSSQKDTTVKELLLSRLRRRSSSDLFPLALYFSFFSSIFLPVFFSSTASQALLGPWKPCGQVLSVS